MALIKCSECGKDISSQAPACPNCGKPQAISGAVPTTIEQTSKKWKKVHLVSWGMIIGGLIFMGNDPAYGLGFWGGVNLIIFGIILRYIGKIGAWWTNK